MSDDVELLKRVYDLFNSRDIESVLAAMHPDVIWANGMEGGTSTDVTRCAAIGNVNGRSSIRMWSPSRFRPTGEVVVKVHQIVGDLRGNLQSDGLVLHVFQIRNALIQRFDIREV